MTAMEPMPKNLKLKNSKALFPVYLLTSTQIFTELQSLLRFYFSR